MQTKKCGNSEHIGDPILPITEFYKDKHAYDGVTNRCKECERAKARAKRAEKAKDPAWRARFNEQNTKYRKGAGKVGQLWEAARQRAKKKGLEFSITKEEIAIPEYCPVLGIKIESGIGRKSDDPTNKLVGAQDSSPSLDRIDNTKGYVSGNVVVISWRANYLKNTASLEELVKLGEYAQKWMNQK